MRKLTEKSTQDAASVKTLTIITLVYLPTTVVLVGCIKTLHVRLLPTDEPSELLLHAIRRSRAIRQRCETARGHIKHVVVCCHLRATDFRHALGLVAVGTSQDSPIVAVPNEHPVFPSPNALQTTSAAKKATGKRWGNGSWTLSVRHRVRLIRQRFILEHPQVSGAQTHCVYHRGF